MKNHAARFACPILTGIALAVVTPAQAQVVESSYRWSKTEAILGGAPSALAAITAQQSGRPASIPTVAPASPGSYYRPAVAHYARPPVSSDRPDVFNSVALSISRSPLDARWSRVSGAGAGGAAGAYAAALHGEDEITKLEAVNSYVNGRVRFVDDRVQFGIADRWMAASETLDRGRGDCEDFALAKRAMLRAAGVPDKDLYLVVLKDLSRRADHAVLVVRAAGRFLVLDNGTDRIVDSSDVADYKPMLTFTAGQTYTHGYRSVAAPVTYASYSVGTPVVLAETKVEPSSGETEAPVGSAESVSLETATAGL